MADNQITLDFPSPKLQATVTGLWSVINNITDTINILVDENSRLHAKLAGFEDLGPDAASTIRELGSRIVELESANSDYQNTIDEFINLIKSKDDELNSLRLALDGNKQSLGKLNEYQLESQKLAEEIQTYRVKLSDYDKLKSMLNTELENRIDIEEQFRQLNLEYAKLTEDMKLISERSKRIEEYKIEIDNLKNDISTKDFELKSSKTRIIDLNNKVAFLENELLDKGNEMTTIVNNADLLHKKLMNANKELNDLELLQNKLSTKEDEIRNLENEINNLRSEFSRDSDSRSELSEKLEVAVYELSNKQTRIDELQQEISHLNIELSIAKNSMKAIEELQEQIKALNNELILKSRLADDLKKDIRNRDKSIDEMKIEISKHTGLFSLETLLAEKEARIVELSQYETEYKKLERSYKEAVSGSDELNRNYKKAVDERLLLENRIFALTKDNNLLKIEMEKISGKLAELRNVNDIKLAKAEKKAEQLQDSSIITDDLNIKKDDLIKNIERLMKKLEPMIKD